MSDDGEFSLVVPFVVVQSNGGLFADDAYVAGYALGYLDHQLQVASLLNLPPRDAMVDRRNLPQLDLVAMHYSYKMTEVDMPLDDVPNADEVRAEWAHITFTRSEVPQ